MAQPSFGLKLFFVFFQIYYKLATTCSVHPVGSVGLPKESKSSSRVYIFKSPTDVYLSITFGMLHYFPISLLFYAFQFGLFAFYFLSLQQYCSYNLAAFSIAFCLECLSHLTFSLAQQIICLLNILLLFSPIVTVSLLTFVSNHFL